MPRLTIALLLGLAGPAAANVELQLVVSGTPFIVDIQHANDDRLFLISQVGRIYVLDDGGVLPTPFLDLTDRVQYDESEAGLLGMAFHPEYASNGLFYVNYVDPSYHTVIARYRVSANPNVADPASAAVVLTQGHPFSNHKGGQIRFGPDGYLYIALGDGGSGGDPENHGQRLDSLLGKILRIDVTSTTPYAVPATNPFVATAGARAEIWSRGLRNPWRFSFDRATGDMFVADVGQRLWEEINVEPAGAGGRNYGWRLMEGTHCFDPPSGCNDGSLTGPVIEYSHSVGCSVTGGFMYRGIRMPAFSGSFFYGDFCSGRIWTATRSGDGSWIAAERLGTSLLISTFGEDSDGELYVSHYDASGQVYRIVQLGTAFTDDPLVPGSTIVRGIHVAELRARIDLLRAARGMPRFIWQDAALTARPVLVRAVHIVELREVLGELYALAGREHPSYTDPTLTTGTAVRAIHLAELRSAVLALE